MPSLRLFFSKNAGTVFLVFALFASLTLNVYQGLDARGAFAPVPGVKVGAKLPGSIPLVDQDGKPAVLAFADDSRKSVLYVLSPLCGWCKKNEANIKALALDASSRFRFVGVSIEAKNLKEYVAEGHVPFPVYLVSSKDQIDKLHFDGTPQTVVVGVGGRVEKSWQGAYLTNNQQEVEKFFGVKLPGLQEIAAAAH
jgi:hypothetical protein